MNILLGRWSGLVVAVEAAVVVVAVSAVKPWMKPCSVLRFGSSWTADGDNTNRNPFISEQIPHDLVHNDSVNVYLTGFSFYSWQTWLLIDDLRCNVISMAETDWWPGVLLSPWSFICDAEGKSNMMFRKNKTDHFIWNSVCQWDPLLGCDISWEQAVVCWGCLQAWSDTAVCEDLRELRGEAEGVWLWLKRSRASFRLEVLSCDSDPESWDSWVVGGKATVIYWESL